MTVRQLVESATNNKRIQYIIYLILCVFYGLGLPIGSWQLKNAAKEQDSFLWLEKEFMIPLIDVVIPVSVLFWVAMIFVVAVSLGKVYTFLKDAFNNNAAFAFFACVGFEICFIVVDNAFSNWFFFCSVGLANLLQAYVGFTGGVKKPENNVQEKKVEEKPKIPEKTQKQSKFWKGSGYIK